MNKLPVQGSKALELTMRDAQDGLTEAAAYFAYRSSPGVLQILSIEPAKAVQFEKCPTAKLPIASPMQTTTRPRSRPSAQQEQLTSSCT